MDEFPRRAFCALLAASAGTVSGRSLVSQETTSNSDGRGEQHEQSDSDGDVTVVTTRAELEAAFEDLSPGETVRISDENAPYRTTRWLDVDVDGVTVLGPGVRTLVEPARGASVGGIRIGHDEPCREVDVRGVGFRGTPGRQERKGERLHGIAVESATNVTLEHNHVRQTYPVDHGDGGSGISVSRNASDVRVANNQVHEFGDRGIQLAGQRVVVYGNVVTDGLDRPVSCDLWDPEGKNRTARSVSIFGNMLGDSVQGSLVGIARNTPVESRPGYVSVFGNVGFGSHKSFCHVRGPERVGNISVQNNVSRQTTDDLRTEKTEKFAGVAVDVDRGRNLSITNNELYEYSGHGVHIDSDLSDVTVQHNSVFDPGLSGIRLVDASEGLVDGNLVRGATSAGIRLKRTSGVVVRGNYVRRSGTAGIVTEGASGPTANDIADNYVAENNRAASNTRSFPAIAVRDDGVRVRGNAVRQNDAPAIAEPERTRGNVYEDNWADGETPWRFVSPDSRARSNVPPTGVHRSLSASRDDDVVRVEFDRAYARRPRLAFGRVGGGIRDVSYETDDGGDFVGARIGVRREGATIDVFVNEG